MQRIDENTYIDDTLVTCAEYQLFIDEMREQGKYYQPDHWTSYQFPKGQAREPILGVRHSDAVAFCDWLTQRENQGWKYRLPTQEETTNFPINLLRHGPLGYLENKEFEFAWVNSIPKDPRGIASALDFPRISNIDVTHANTFNNALDFNRNRNFNLDRAIDPSRSHILDLARIATIDHTLNQTIETDLALDLYVDIVTLRERIAGRSPAFEGIRLVKERIR